MRVLIENIDRNQCRLTVSGDRRTVVGVEQVTALTTAPLSQPAHTSLSTIVRKSWLGR
jgi:hypothetical protein